MKGKVQEKQRMLERLVSNMPGGVVTILVTLDDRYQILYANEGFYALTGYDKAEWEKRYGEYAQEVIYPEDRGSIQGKIQEVLQNNEYDKNVNIEFRRKTISYIFFYAKCL